jgi:hypothetical protein
MNCLVRLSCLFQTKKNEVLVHIPVHMLPVQIILNVQIILLVQLTLNVQIMC